MRKPKNELDTPIPVRLTFNQVKKLKNKSDDTGIPVSVMIRQAVEQYLNN